VPAEGRVVQVNVRVGEGVRGVREEPGAELVQLRVADALELRLQDPRRRWFPLRKGAIERTLVVARDPVTCLRSSASVWSRLYDWYRLTTTTAAVTVARTSVPAKRKASRALSDCSIVSDLVAHAPYGGDRAVIAELAP